MTSSLSSNLHQQHASFFSKCADVLTTPSPFIINERRLNHEYPNEISEHVGISTLCKIDVELVEKEEQRLARIEPKVLDRMLLLETKMNVKLNMIGKDYEGNGSNTIYPTIDDYPSTWSLPSSFTSASNTHVPLHQHARILDLADEYETLHKAIVEESNALSLELIQVITFKNLNSLMLKINNTTDMSDLHNEYEITKQLLKKIIYKINNNNEWYESRKRKRSSKIREYGGVTAPSMEDIVALLKD